MVACPEGAQSTGQAPQEGRPSPAPDIGVEGLELAGGVECPRGRVELPRPDLGHDPARHYFSDTRLLRLSPLSVRSTTDADQVFTPSGNVPLNWSTTARA